MTLTRKASFEVRQRWPESTAAREGARRGNAVLRVVLTKPDLEAKVLAAANSLRGLSKRADFKQYVFPLLLRKRLSE